MLHQTKKIFDMYGSKGSDSSETKKATANHFSQVSDNTWTWTVRSLRLWNRCNKKLEPCKVLKIGPFPLCFGRFRRGNLNNFFGWNSGDFTQTHMVCLKAHVSRCLEQLSHLKNLNCAKSYLSSEGRPTGFRRQIPCVSDRRSVVSSAVSSVVSSAVAVRCLR